MTPEEASATETTILNICRTTVATLAPKLAERGMECERPKLSVYNAEPDQYGSEVQAMIFRDGQIVDALEFFVFRDGHAVITPEVAERYTREVLLDTFTNR